MLFVHLSKQLIFVHFLFTHVEGKVGDKERRTSAEPSHVKGQSTHPRAPTRAHTLSISASDFMARVTLPLFFNCEICNRKRSDQVKRLSHSGYTHTYTHFWIYAKL